MQTPILFRLIGILTLGLTLPALASRAITVNQVSSCSEFTDLGTALVVLHNLSKVDQNLTIRGGMKYMVGDDTFWGPKLGLTVGNYMSGWMVRGYDANGSVTFKGQSRTYSTAGSLCGKGSFCQATNIDPVNGPQVLLRPGGTVLLQTSRHGCGAHVSFDIDIAIAEDRGAVEGSATFGCYSIDAAGNPQLTTQTSTAYTINGGRPF